MIKRCGRCNKNFTVRNNIKKYCHKCEKYFRSLLKPKAEAAAYTDKLEQKKFSIDVYREKWRTPGQKAKSRRDRWKYRIPKGGDHFDTCTEMKNVGRALLYNKEMRGEY